MGKLTANPRRFFGAFCSVVNMLSEEKGAAPPLLITPIRRLEEGSGCTRADTGTGAALRLCWTWRSAAAKYARVCTCTRRMLWVLYVDLNLQLLDSIFSFTVI